VIRPDEITIITDTGENHLKGVPLFQMKIRCKGFVGKKDLLSAFSNEGTSYWTRALSDWRLTKLP
jgi:hypothetical protein